MKNRVAAGSDTTGDVEAAFREAYGKAVSTLVRVFGDISSAEDAVQDAFVVAAERWPAGGIPANPAGWIVTTARNHAIDTFRRDARGRELQREMAQPPLGEQTDMSWESDTVVDDQLRLIFTCCHPALRPEHQIALTLRLLGGLTVDEVARSFLISEPAMSKRLTRAKYKIKAANIPYRVPDGAELPARLRTVLTVLYLIYNAGADRPDGGTLRIESIRLARELVGLMPDEPEAAGLLALLMLNESRAQARWDSGRVVRLKDQDRSLWDSVLIEEGQAIVLRCIRRAQPGPFQIQAAIQAVHSAASSVEATDWEQILDNYDRLMKMAPTAVVALNRAIVVGEIHGADAGLESIIELEEELAGYHLMYAARGAMLGRLGRREEAEQAYLKAAELADGEADRRFLLEQAAAICE
ncbi:MAG: sigma-70 family RNA polymerase sigma factor [Acidimicrobiia bacterium]|nr:sigma-70 family RNA polymerase sigma factor [Acidimicrobiia bacterium]